MLLIILNDSSSVTSSALHVCSLVSLVVAANLTCSLLRTVVYLRILFRVPRRLLLVLDPRECSKNRSKHLKLIDQKLVELLTVIDHLSTKNFGGYM